MLLMLGIGAGSSWGQNGNHVLPSLAVDGIEPGEVRAFDVNDESIYSFTAVQNPSEGFCSWRHYKNSSASSVIGNYIDGTAAYGEEYNFKAKDQGKGVYHIGLTAQRECQTNGHYGYDYSVPYIFSVHVHDLPKIALKNLSSRTVTLKLGDKIEFSAEMTNGEGDNQAIIWRRYASATPKTAHDGEDLQNNYNKSQSDRSSDTYTFEPTAIGEYYIGVTAQQRCPSHETEKNADDTDIYEACSPEIVKVNVVTEIVHSLPTLSNVQSSVAPVNGIIEIGVNTEVTFSAQASVGTGDGRDPGVVWRQYSSASQASAHVGNKLLGNDYSNTYTFKASKPGVYYIGADAQQHCTLGGSYEASVPHIFTIKVVDNHNPTVTLLKPTSRILTLEQSDVPYQFKAEASSPEGNPTIIWRRYYSATPLTSEAQKDTGSMPDEGEGKNVYGGTYDFTPSEVGTYYIGVDAGQYCQDDNKKWERSSPCVVTVNVVKKADMNTGYYNYNNRLAAQWNFDICDPALFQVNMMNNNRWTADYSGTNGTDALSASNGKVIYTYQNAIGQNGSDDTKVDTYAELTYNEKDVIPVAAGLKFKAPAGSIKIQADIANGEATGIHLILGEGVKMYIPYVENTYRNDKNNVTAPENNYDDFKNCLHHIKRDILYFATVKADGTATDIQDFVNPYCIDLKDQRLFGDNAGFEYVNDKYFKKLNYLGKNGTPCIVQFTKEATIDRIGVNRNLTYSFYSQYIYENGMDKPEPRMRIVGSPTGQKVANVGDATSAVTYQNAIVMTYGGWKNSAGSNSYSAYDGTTVTDSWSSLKENASSVAVDGFSVISQNDVIPTSESLMPSSTTGNKYHPACHGLFQFGQEENYTPWTLPCRGGYLKFEPTLPGVLNVNVFQKRDARYYILDEFGNAVSEGVFWKTAVAVDKDTDDEGFKVNSDSYVKYSFNVYPGKTYYMFSAEDGIGLAGFYFEPYVYRKSATDELGRQDIELASLTLEDGVDYTKVTIPASSTRTVESPIDNKGGYVKYPITKDNRAVAVTLNRLFAANTWNSICLPFSMNKNAMEEVFGEGTRVVLLRDVQDKANMSSGLTTANFIAHENQDIIAGYPYFILPTKAVEKITTNAYIPTTTASIPVISGLGFKTTTGISIASENYGGMEEYSFTGTLTGVTAPQGSYYMNTSGSLSRCTKDAGVALKPYRAYISFSGTYESAKALDSVFFGNPDDKLNEDEATGVEEISIENVLFKNGILTQSANVYNMQGQIIRQNVTNLQGLPKGAYIVNGKKFVIK